MKTVALQLDEHRTAVVNVNPEYVLAIEESPRGPQVSTVRMCGGKTYVVRGDRETVARCLENPGA